MYTPGVLVAGVTSPVAVFIDKPAGVALYVPPVTPVCVTEMDPALLQYGDPVYAIDAVGAALIVIVVVVEKAGQPPDAGIEYVTVYVFGVLVEGVTNPVDGSIVNPAGLALNVPPTEPVSVTGAVPPLIQ